jgi:hypothetical protein
VGEAEVAEKGKQCRRRRSIVKYTTRGLNLTSPPPPLKNKTKIQFDCRSQLQITQKLTLKRFYLKKSNRNKLN